MKSDSNPLIEWPMPDDELKAYVQRSDARFEALSARVDILEDAIRAIEDALVHIPESPSPQ